jgi:hypothetical protein
MIKFICNNCGENKDLMRATLKVMEDGKVRTVEALCKCGEYMQEIEKDFDGFPCLIRTEPTLSKKGDKLWEGTKEKLIGERGINFPDEMHDTLKVKFSSEWQSIEINDKQIGLQKVNSTASMNTKEFEIYVDQIRIWALTELGIRLMLPNEYE